MNNILKYRNIILLTIGILLIIVSFCILFYDKIELLKSNVFDEVNMLKYRENNNDNLEVNNDENLDVETDEVDTETVSLTEEDKKKIAKEFIGYLEISKVNLKQGLVAKKSYYNNVNRNIKIIDASDYPDKEKGNVILAAHSGTSSVSYFKNLYKLVLGDKAKIYYKGYVYTYEIVNIYNIPKVGKAKIKRDDKMSTLTLITCTHNSKTEQTVYILELILKESEDL